MTRPDDVQALREGSLLALARELLREFEAAAAAGDERCERDAFYRLVLTNWFDALEQDPPDWDKIHGYGMILVKAENPQGFNVGSWRSRLGQLGFTLARLVDINRPSRPVENLCLPPRD